MVLSVERRVVREFGRKIEKQGRKNGEGPASGHKSFRNKVCARVQLLYNENRVPKKCERVIMLLLSIIS